MKQRRKCLEASNYTLQPSISKENVEVVCSTRPLGVQQSHVKDLNEVSHRQSFFAVHRVLNSHPVGIP